MFFGSFSLWKMGGFASFGKKKHIKLI